MIVISMTKCEFSKISKCIDFIYISTDFIVPLMNVSQYLLKKQDIRFNIVEFTKTYFSTNCMKKKMEGTKIKEEVRAYCQCSYLCLYIDFSSVHPLKTHTNISPSNSVLQKAHLHPILCMNYNFHLFFPAFNQVLQGKVLTHIYSVNIDNCMM